MPALSMPAASLEVLLAPAPIALTRRSNLAMHIQSVRVALVVWIYVLLVAAAAKPTTLIETNSSFFLS